MDDFPEPDTPVKTVILRLGIFERDVFQVVLARAAQLDVFLGHRSSPAAVRRSKDLHELRLPVAVEPSKVRDPLDGLLLGVHLDDGETGYQLLPLQEGAVGDRDLALGKEDPGLLAIEPAAGDEDSLFDGLLHELPQLGRVPRLLPLRWGTVNKELHILLLSFAAATPRRADPSPGRCSRCSR